MCDTKEAYAGSTQEAEDKMDAMVFAMLSALEPKTTEEMKNSKVMVVLVTPCYIDYYNARNSAWRWYARETGKPVLLVLDIDLTVDQRKICDRMFEKLKVVGRVPMEFKQDKAKDAASEVVKMLKALDLDLPSFSEC